MSKAIGSGKADIYINKVQLKMVNSFKYLEATLSKDNISTTGTVASPYEYQFYFTNVKHGLFHFSYVLLLSQAVRTMPATPWCQHCDYQDKQCAHIFFNTLQSLHQGSQEEYMISVTEFTGVY